MFTLGIVACNNKDDDEIELINNEQEETFNVLFSAGFETPSEDINLDDGTSLQKMKFGQTTESILFEASDVFGIFGVDIPGHPKRQGEIVALDDGGASITISCGFIKGKDDDYLDGPFYAVYPYDAAKSLSSDNKILATIPTEQHPGVDNSFDPKAFISCAYSAEKAQQFQFKNAVSMLRVNIPQGAKKIKYFEVKSLGGSIAGNIEIEMNDGIITNVTPKDNNQTTIKFSREDGDFLTDDVDYYVCLAPTQLQSGFTVTYYTDESNYSVSKYSTAQFKRAKIAKVSPKNYFYGTSKWYKVVRDGQLAIDLGMIFGHERVYWSYYNYGAISYSDCGDLFGWAQDDGKCGVTYQDITSYDSRHFPVMGNWRPATAQEFDELFTGSIVSESIKETDDVWKVTYKNRSLYFPRDVHVKAIKMTYISGDELYVLCEQVCTKEQLLERYSDLTKQRWYRKTYDTYGVYDLLKVMIKNSYTTDDEIVEFIQSTGNTVPSSIAEVKSKNSLYDACYWCYDGDAADNVFYGNFFHIVDETDKGTYNSFSYPWYISMNISEADWPTFEDLAPHTLALPYRMVYREAVLYTTPTPTK